jgi:hypothetical protein
MERIRFSQIVVAAVLFSQTAIAQEGKSIASVFLPGIVSTDGNDFNACFTKDSKSFLFSRTMDNKSQLFITSQINGNWVTPERLPFCKQEFAYADPAFSPAGELYFVSDRPTSATDTTRDYDIWKTSFANGQWIDPVNVAVLNSPQDEYYISFTKDGDAYFSSSLKGGYGEEDIYVASFVNDKYITPVNLGKQVNTIHSEYDPFISESGEVLFFASSGRKDSFGKADLYWIERKRDEWGEVNHFGREINTPTRDYCPFVADEGTFFFSSEGQVKAATGQLLPKSLLQILKK